MSVELTVVIPTFNRRASLLALIHSLTSQDLAPNRFEVVVVIDGSTDGSAEALAELNLPFKLTVHRLPNGGAGAARNAGASLAESEFVLFIDDDMVVRKTTLSAHLAALRSHPGSAVVGMIETIFQHDGIGRRSERFWDSVGTFADGKRLTIHECCSGNLSLPLDLFRKTGGFFEPIRRLEDAELGFRLEKSGVELRFAKGAAAIQTVVKGAAATLADAYVAGMTSVVLFRERPEFLRRLRDPTHRPPGMFMVTAVRFGLRLPIPELALGRISSARPGARHLHHVLWFRAYLRGVRSEAASDAEFVAFLRRR
ncbi:MAG: glycosyltransferase family 2 protein [bacterium]